jgi:hypothetical protein
LAREDLQQVAYDPPHHPQLQLCFH